MKFEDPINDGLFLKRYKRFFADIQQGSEVLTAHVPNTGSMKGLLESHVPCRYTTNDDPKRKLKYTLQMLKTKNPSLIPHRLGLQRLNDQPNPSDSGQNPLLRMINDSYMPSK